MPKSKGTLLLLPNLLGDHRHHELFLPSSVDRAVADIDGLIAESEKAARRYLSRFEIKKTVQTMPVAFFNKNTPDDDIDFLLEPMTHGEKWGLITDAGVPCIADPGAKLVARARVVGVTVRAFVGPCSFVMALMLSGLPAQSFTFHGYLPHGDKGIKKLEQQAATTQLFMEAPHRCQKLLEMLVETLDDDTWLCVAWDLTLPSQGVVSQTVRLWKKSPLPNIHRKPAVFMIHRKDSSLDR